MNVERYLRLIAGCFVLASLLLGYFHSPYWFLLTGFVALNLIQSAFTNWCPMMTFLRWLGARSEAKSIADRARTDRKSTRLNSITVKSRMPSSA